MHKTPYFGLNNITFHCHCAKVAYEYAHYIFKCILLRPLFHHGRLPNPFLILYSSCYKKMSSDLVLEMSFCLSLIAQMVEYSVSWERLFSISFQATVFIYRNCFIRIPRHVEDEHTQIRTSTLADAVLRQGIRESHNRLAAFATLRRLRDTRQSWVFVPDLESLIATA